MLSSVLAQVNLALKILPPVPMGKSTHSPPPFTGRMQLLVHGRYGGWCAGQAYGMQRDGDEVCNTPHISSAICCQNKHAHLLGLVATIAETACRPGQRRSGSSGHGRNGIDVFKAATDKVSVCRQVSLSRTGCLALTLAPILADPNLLFPSRVTSRRLAWSPHLDHSASPCELHIHVSTSWVAA